MVALHLVAQRSRPPEPLPAFNIDDVLDGVSNSNREAQRLAGMIADPTFETGAQLSKDRARAIRYYRAAAQQGDKIAALRLGLLLTSPGSPAYDVAQGRKVLEGIAQADAAAALRLAELILAENGDKAGRDRAVGLLKLAAKDPDVGGIAAARLRLLGEAPVS
jgi:TPR repeat protein